VGVEMKKKGRLEDTGGGGTPQPLTPSLIFSAPQRKLQNERGGRTILGPHVGSHVERRGKQGRVRGASPLQVRAFDSNGRKAPCR